MNEPYVGEFGALVESTVRVLTWNIWWRYGPWVARAEPIIAELERHTPDVICLQEVWGERDDATERSFSATIAERLGFHHVYGAAAVDSDDVWFGNAILARWPIVHDEWHPLPPGDRPSEHRVVVHALVDGPRGRLPIYCTHLNWQMAHSEVRQAQVRFVAELIASHSEEAHPPVWGGDFNAVPDSDEMRLLTGLSAVPVPDLVFRDAWREVENEGPGYTSDNRNPYMRAEMEGNQRIDFILVGEPRGHGVGHVTACRLVGDEPTDPQRPDGLWPSDHFGVVADLRY